jgi:hypothetical protein
MASSGLLDANRLITIGEITGQSDADVEDLFDEDDYLRLFNSSMGMTVAHASITGTDPVVVRLARLMGVPRFDHGKPADHFLRNRDTILPSLSATTLERFERLFERVNATLPS